MGAGCSTSQSISSGRPAHRGQQDEVPVNKPDGGSASSQGIEHTTAAPESPNDSLAEGTVQAEGDAEDRPSQVKKKKVKKEKAEKKVLQANSPEAVTLAARFEVMKKCFTALDLDGNGAIEIDEWKKYLVGAGVDQAVVDKHAEAVLKSMDTDNDGKITFLEFSTRCVRLSKEMSDTKFAQFMADLVNTCRLSAAQAGASGTFNSYGELIPVERVLESLTTETRVKKLRMCFSALDLDKSGYISLDELKSFLGNVKCVNDSGSIMAEAQTLMMKMDTDFDSQVSNQEFMAAMSRFKNTVTDEEFAKLVDGIFNIVSGKQIEDNVLRDAVDRDSTIRNIGATEGQ